MANCNAQVYVEYREAVHSPQKNSGPSRRHRLATTTHAALDPAIEAAGDAAAQAVIDAAAAAPTAAEAVAAAEQANLAVADAAHEAVAHASPSPAIIGAQAVNPVGRKDKVRHEVAAKRVMYAFPFCQQHPISPVWAQYKCVKYTQAKQKC